MRAFFVCFFGCLTSGGRVFGQQAPDAVFKATTKLVQVSVIAQDKLGKPVADLRREEFQIFDNGSPQEIRLFLAESEKSTSAVSESKTPGTFTNQIAPPAGSHSGYSVILIDDLSTNFGDPLTGEEGIGAAKERTLRMLRSIPAGERIAIYALGRKLQVLCEFSSDRDLLERQLRTWKPLIDIPITSLGMLDEAGAPAKLRAEAARVDALQRASDSNDEMEQVADHLAGIPGRKNLIWLATRFTISPRALQRLNAAGVAIYPVDAQGVCPFPSCPPRPTEAMNAIAAFTGGVAYFLRNDLDVAIREAMEDGRVSYTLGFYPPGDDRTAQAHQLAVRVSRRDVTLRYHGSYRTQVPRAVSATTKADLARALDQPTDVSAVPVKASATLTAGRLDVEIMLDVESLGLVQEGSRWTGKIETVARFTTADGLVAGDVFSETVRLNLHQGTYDAAVRGGLPYHKLELKIPDKAAELKLLFANPDSGKIGTLTIPLSEVAVPEVAVKVP
jgi:VWFA-related protein